ncbi:hypothetical protein [Nitrospira lenta]|uniref:Lipoprotein n=1 Tax=Nitrospira lenta TaxID=1436998 RepID=A0A330L5R7_9BACT|nr:hypothetical protein [Nitrospira lenta]SPP65114.1 conserved exported hypothetical protein [Nitrospira lenta]
MTIRLIVSSLLLTGLLTGCGGSTWVHPTKPSTEFTNEYNRCQNLVIRDPKLQQGSQLLILNATERCLQREGWRIVESE